MKLEFLNGEDFLEPFSKGSNHNVASYAIAAEGHRMVQDGCHGPGCECDRESMVMCTVHHIASDAPFYNWAPEKEHAQLMVEAWNAVHDGDLGAIAEVRAKLRKL